MKRYFAILVVALSCVLSPNNLLLAQGKMYWGAYMPMTMFAPIHRANLDGTGVEDLITNTGYNVAGIALDIAGVRCIGSITLKKSNAPI